MAGAEGKVLKRTKISCPSCAAPITLRSFQVDARVVCEYCGALIDKSHHGLSIVAQVAAREKHKPLIPLGARGAFEGRTWELIGFMRRQAPEFHWFEYLLYNPYYGFRFLVDANRHWSFVRPISELPLRATSWHPSIHLDGKAFKQFASYSAEVTYVAGEFPWKVKVGDTALVTDYIAPPLQISEERSADEVNNSLATYMSAAEVFGAFNKAIPAAEPIGVMANQPNPHAAALHEMGRAALIFLGVFAVWTVIYVGSAARKVIVRQAIPIVQEKNADPADELPVITTETFKLEGEHRNLVISFDCPSLQNNWIAYAGSLINVDREQARGFDVEFEYWSGSDWSEGSRDATVVLGDIPAGNYKIVLAAETGVPQPQATGMASNLVVTRDVPLYRYVFFVFFFLISLPFFQWIRYTIFESRRWADSDFAGGGS